MQAWLLNADCFEWAVVHGAINHRVGKLRGVLRLPFEIDMALEGFGLQIVGHGKRGGLGGGRLRLVVDANFVDDQRVRRVVGLALGEEDRVQYLRIERMNRFSREAIEWDSN